MAGHRQKYVLAAVALLVSVLIAYLAPQVIGGTVDSILGDKPLDAPKWVVEAFEAMGGKTQFEQKLWICAIALVLIALVSGMFMFLKGRWAAQAAEAVTSRMRNRMYDHIQQLPCSFFDRSDTGDLIQRCTSDIETVHRFLSEQVADVMRAILTILVAIPLMLMMSPRMTLVSTFLMPFIIAYTVAFFVKIRFAFQASDEAEARMTGTIQQNLTGIRVVRAFARQDYENDRFAEKNAEFRDLDCRLIQMLAWYWSISDVMCFAQRGVVLFFGGWWAISGRADALSTGDLIIFFFYVNMYLWPVRSIGRTLTELSKAMVSLGRLDEVLNELPEDHDDKPTSAAPLEGQIEFDSVSFSHGDLEVLKDVSFRIEPGQTMAILGPSGSGKSTIVNLLLRLYDYDSGAIRIDGTNIREMGRKNLRGQIGTVMQEPFLFSKSLRDNIRLGKSHAADEEIVLAAETAYLHTSVEHFDHGYETLVGERGITLSGGQRQRVALARAILKHPAILILDDALSAVDTRTEAMILRALRNRHGKSTTIVIAHRLSTLARADKIIVLDGGKVLQAGTHEQLVAQDGMYRDLWKIQNALESDLADEMDSGPAPKEDDS